MSKVEELLKDNKLAEKLSMAKLNDLLKKEEEDKKPSKAVIIFAIIGVLVTDGSNGNMPEEAGLYKNIKT